MRNFNQNFGRASEKESTYRRIDFRNQFPAHFKDNRVASYNYSVPSLLLTTIYQEFWNISYFWLIPLTVLELTFHEVALSLRLSSLVPVVLLLLYAISRNLRMLFKRYQVDKVKNDSIVQVLVQGAFAPKKSKEVTVGDILLIKNKEIVPADILLLGVDNSNSEIFVDVTSVIGGKNLTRKKPVKETQTYINTDGAGIISLYKHIESIRISHPNNSFTEFSGKIKIKGNPRAIKLELDNLIIRGTKVAGDWIVGLAVYTGMDTKIWLNSRQGPVVRFTKTNKLLNILMLFNFALILVYLFLSFGLSYYNNSIIKDSWSDLLVYNLFLFNNLVPGSLVISLKISKFLQMVLFNRKNPEIVIENARVFEDLGKIEYILAGKSGILIENYLKVQTCIIKTKIFNLTDEPESSSLYNQESYLIDSDIGARQESKIQNFTDLVGKIKRDGFDSETWVFILGLTLCTHYFPGEEMKNISEDEKELVGLAESLGVFLVHRTARSAIIKYRDKEYKYEILGSHGLFAEFPLNKIVVRDLENSSDSSNSILLAKGNTENIMPLFENEADFIVVEDHLKSFTLQNLRKILFVYKFMSYEETKEFLFDYKNAKLCPINIEGRVASVFEKFESGVGYLGIIGLENPIKKEARDCIKNLNQAGLKIWLVTGDNEESTLLSGSALGMYTSDTDIIKLSTFFSAAECLQAMTKAIDSEIFKKYNMPSAGSVSMNQIERSRFARDNFLENLSKENESIKYEKINDPENPKINAYKEISLISERISLKSKNRSFSNLSNLFETSQSKKINFKSINYVLSVSSQGMDYALSSSVHRSKFIQLLFCAKSVFFHSMSPDQKIKVAILLKNNFAFKPSVLAVGNGNTDSGMLGEAHIGVSVAPLHTQFEHTPDIRALKFAQLSNLLLNCGHYSHIRLSRIILSVIFKEMMLVTVLFLYQTQSFYSGANFVDYDLIVLYDLFLGLIPLILLGIFYKDFDEIVTFKSPSFYSLGYSGYFLTPLKIFKSYFMGFINGVVVYCASVYGTSYISNSQGFTEDLESKGLLVLILMALIFFHQIIIENLKYKLSVMVLIFGISSLVLVVLLTCNQNITSYSLSFDILANQRPFWFILFFIPIGSFGVSTIIELIVSYLNPNLIKTRKKTYQLDLKSVFKDTDEWTAADTTTDLDNSRLNLRFKSKFKEYEYQRVLNTEYAFTFRLIFIVFALIGWILYVLVLTDQLNYLNSNLYSLLFPILLTLICCFLLYKNLKLYYFSIVIFIGAIVLTVTQACLYRRYTAFRYSIKTIFFTISVNLNYRSTCIEILIIYICSVVTVFIESQAINYNEFYYISFSFTILSLGISLLSLLIAYVIDINKRKEHLFLEKVKVDSIKAKNILSYLLPQFVRKRVKEGERYIAEDKGTVSVIFCDMYNFDDILSQYNPQELTSFLDEIFSRFDKLCETIGVTKIETVGKTYLACAGLKDSEIEMDIEKLKVCHARRAVEMGLAVIKEVKKICMKDGTPLIFKIGINSGPVTAGVVGYHKPQFSLVGDTVNTASRMSSTLTDLNAIQISLATYDMIDDKRGLTFYDRCPKVKGKGEMETKIVEISERNKNDPISRNSDGSIIENNLLLSANFDSSFSSPYRQSLNLINIHKKEKKNLNLPICQIISKVFNFCDKDTDSEKDFRGKKLVSCFNVQYYGIWIAIICNAFLIIIEVVSASIKLKYSSIYRIFILFLEEALTILLLVKLKSNYKSIRYCYCLNLVFLIEFPAFFVISFFEDQMVFIICLYFNFRFLVMNYCSGLLFNKSIVTNVIACAFWFGTISVIDSDPLCIIQSVLFILIVLITLYIHEYDLRKNSIITQIASENVEKTEELLAQMVPPHVLKNLHEENMITDRFSDVTLMYADIVGFTAWSSTRSPKEVVGMLSELFSQFDRLCLKHNVYKVHTIGDCYVVMGYKTDKKRIPAQEAVNVLNFANSLIEVIQENNRRNNCELNMRVGIHTGEVIGGITGTDIVRYDIYGQDVLIANKMESNGEPDKTVVSEVTKNLLEDYKQGKYKFTQIKEVHIDEASKTIKVYLVEYLQNVLESSKY
jgi:magnesium-transporting ATPase (P-type)/class 3 adenylate cyclase